VKLLSSRVAAMPSSGIRTLMELADTMDDVIQLGVGEPDFDTPSAVVEGAFAAARSGFTRYTPTAGYPSLRRAVAEKFAADYGVALGADGVVVTPGAVAALTSAIMAIVDQGDEILVPDPGWPNYVSICILAGAQPISYPLLRSTDYAPDFEALSLLVTRRTKVIIVNSPNNPTGAVYSDAVVRKIVEFADAHDLYVLSDEIYEALVFEGEHVPAARFDTQGRVVTVLGCSKTYAMTGWRIGFAIANRDIAASMTKVQQSTLSCPSSVSQKAAEAALAMDQAQVTAMRSAYRMRRDLVSSVMGPVLTTIPRGAFYGLVDVSAVSMDSYAVAKDLLRRKHVATAPGETFGSSGRGLIRVSFATSEESLAEGTSRILEYLYDSELR
jgi:aspartate/methionine/tyrosine aminotransferase